MWNQWDVRWNILLSLFRVSCVPLKAPPSTPRVCLCICLSLPACVYVCLAFSCLLVSFCVFSDGSRLSVCLFLSVYVLGGASVPYLYSHVCLFVSLCVSLPVCSFTDLRTSICLCILCVCLFVYKYSHLNITSTLKKKLDTVSFLMVQSVFPLWLMIRRTSPLTNYLSDYGLAVNHVPVRGWTRRLVVRLFLSAALGACTSMVASSLAVKRRGNLNYLILLRWVMNLFVTQLLTNTQNYGQQTEVFTPFSLGGRTNKRRMRNVH